MWEENLEIVRQGWRDWFRRDVEAMAVGWDPEVIWSTEHFHNWPESGYRGPEGVRQFLAEWLEIWGDYEVEVEDILAAPDGRIVSLITHRGKGHESGIPMVLEMAQIITIRNGRIIRFDNYDVRSEALRAAGLSAPAESQHEA